MLNKKWASGIAAVLIVVLLFAGFMAIAAEAGSGSKQDPLVTLSYINELVPDLEQKIADAINKKTGEFDEALDAKVNEAMAEIDSTIRQFQSDYAGNIADEELVSLVADAVVARMGSGSAPPSGEAGGSIFQVVKVASGKTVVGSVGCEILWRLGSGTCSAPSNPGLIDVTTGGELAPGSALVQNHLYVVTVDGRGFKTTSDCTVLLKGPYVIQ